MTTDFYSETEKQIMLKTAADSIQYGLAHHQTMPVNLSDYPENLQKRRACFVTLELNNQLRGCIGSLQAHQALIQDIAHNAFAAAFGDTRFFPLNAQELSLLDIHISILSEPTPIQFDSEQDLLRQLRPNIDGLIFRDQGHQGTFLPSVWKTLPTSEEFLTHLKLKAGFPKEYWSDTLKIDRYEAQMVKSTE